mgnify:CR=1 FL=1
MQCTYKELTYKFEITNWLIFLAKSKLTKEDSSNIRIYEI